MRFSLQDVRKSIQRRGGEPAVSLHFLSSGELHAEITHLIAYYESLLGQPQRSFSADDARAFIGEYRMANCMIATLSHWYNWQSPEWTTAIAAMDASDKLAVFVSSTELRLALYDYVNEQFAGFLSVQHRDEALQAFAAQFRLTAAELEYLLQLDSEEEAILVREAPEPPDAQAVVLLYNQWVFEAALFNASHVRFIIDCAAFVRMQLADQQKAVPGATSGIGSVIKQLCYLARRLGVYYDLEYAAPIDEAAGEAGQGPLLSLTLYGPQDVTGAPQQYGLRLARLCRILLGYGVAKASPAAPQPSQRSRRKAQLAASIVQAEARIHFLQHAYKFVMTANLPQFIPPPAPQEALVSSPNGVPGAHSELFDSSIEQTFSEAFISLAASQGADGWQLEREPEPLLLDKGIFIPDFALTRGRKRVYLEILGFWTPLYQERKIQKLQQLLDRDDLLLALPVQASQAFAPIMADFPVVVYHDLLSASSVLQALRKHYDDFLQRLESIDVAAIRQAVRREGFVPEQACYALLHCFRRSELLQAAERVVTGDEGEIAFVAGVGLFDRAWLEEVSRFFVSWLASVRTTTLREAIAVIKEHAPHLQAASDTTVESLLGLWPQIRLRRDSIFETVVVLQQEEDTQEEGSREQEVPVASIEIQVKQGTSRERRSAPKRRRPAQSEVIQGDLWS